MASSTYTGDYSRTGKPAGDKAESTLEKAAETAGRVTGTVKEAAKSAGDKAASVASRAAETTGRVVDTVEEAAPSIREARESLGEVGGYFSSATRKSVRDQPMASLAVAALAGFVVGALWKM